MESANSGSFCLNKVCIILFELVACERGANSLPLCVYKSLEILYMMVSGLISNVYSGI